MPGWRHGNHCAGLNCSWLFNNSKGQDTGEKNPKPVPLFLMSFVWQEAFQPRQRISTQECLMSKSTHTKKKGEVGGNPTPGLLSLWPSSNGLERAGRGSQGLAAVLQAQQRGGPSTGDAMPCSSPSPLSARAVDVHAGPRTRPGSGSCPARPPSLPPVTAHVTAPNTAHGAGAAVPTPGSRRGPASAPSPRGSDPHTPLSLRPGLSS